MKEQFETLFYNLMKKVENRPCNKDGRRDGNFNYIHQQYVADAMVKTREMIEELCRQIKLYEDNIGYILEHTPGAVKAAGQGSKADDLCVGLAISIARITSPAVVPPSEEESVQLPDFCPACGGLSIEDEEGWAVCTTPGSCVWMCRDDEPCGRENCPICKGRRIV